jgi:hypothetical protein
MTLIINSKGFRRITIFISADNQTGMSRGPGRNQVEL